MIQSLERGCDIHPWVNEPYPCTNCIEEYADMDLQDTGSIFCMDDHIHLRKIIQSELCGGGAI